MGSLIAFLGIIIMIIFHEWGHFIAGRIFKVPVYEFAVGMGPKLLSHKGKKGTIFTLRALPIGGFCAFDDEENSAIEDLALDRIPIYQKILISFAGPLINLLTGLLIFFMLTLFIGTKFDTNEVDSVVDSMPAFEYIQPDDKIISIDGIMLNENNTLTNIVKESNGKELAITVKRGEELKTFNITPQYSEKDQRYYIGVVTKLGYKKATTKELLTLPLQLTTDSVHQVFGGLFSLITGKTKLTEMSGLIGIVTFANEYATLQSLYSFFTILAVVSINLGIMNLLPIPGLDGSKILEGIFRAIFKKRLPEKVINILYSTSFAILIGFMIIVAISDIAKILFK